jgi:hypothetical protein
MPTVCTTVGCPDYCAEKKAEWTADCNNAAPEAWQWCYKHGEEAYKYCQGTGEWPAKVPPASCYTEMQKWLYYWTKVGAPVDPPDTPLEDAILKAIRAHAKQLYIQCLDTGVWSSYLHE